MRETLVAFVEAHADRLATLASDLVRIPSENMPPDGSERACQEYLAASLRRFGWSPDVYSLDDVPGLREHPLFWGNQNYTDRPNLGARLKGSGGGRSLVLSGHIDTVPAGTQPWTRDPFSGQVEHGRVYGRGSNDMKGGVAVSLFVIQALAELGIRLRGDLVFETVVDEEFGGCNGTLAGRLAGYNGNAAVLTEPSFLRICPAQRGGRTVHITFRAPGGVLTEGRLLPGVTDQVRHFLSRLERFAAVRRARAPVHRYYRDHIDPVPVSVTKIITGPWGTREPITIPEECRIEMYWQTMPGESQKDIEHEFHEWFQGVIAEAPEIFGRIPDLEFPIRWLPGSAISESEPLIGELAESAEAILGRPPVVAGIEGPCDLYVFQQHFSIPAVLWGPRGGNTHAADEYLDLGSAVQAAQVLLLFVCKWCGIAEGN